MDLLIIRHATACPATDDQDDSLRALSPEGRQQFANMVEQINRLPLRIQQVYHSPWLRAVQTAEILRSTLSTPPELCIAIPELAQSPSDALFDLLYLQNDAEHYCVALVGHQPWLSTLIAWLLEGNRNNGYRYILDPGGVAWLQGDVKSQGMHLRTLMSPSMV